MRSCFPPALLMWILGGAGLALMPAPGCPQQRPGEGGPDTDPEAPPLADSALPFDGTFSAAPFSITLSPQYQPPACSWMQVRVQADAAGSRVGLQVTDLNGSVLAECMEPAAESLVLTCRAPADGWCRVTAVESGRPATSYRLQVWQPWGEMGNRPPYGPGGQAPTVPTCLSPAP